MRQCRLNDIMKGEFQSEKILYRCFTEGINIFLALDVSESMRAEDFKDANRLQTAKSVIRISSGQR